ncbi:MAG TPA: CpsB/CapC family capsule biosynthesis tyrosine phosphatase, partial [Polyangia bacterium]
PARGEKFRLLSVAMSYVDLHAHHLPALDDGAKDPRMSLEMVNAVAALGFTTLSVTPHQRARMYLPTRAAIDEAFAALKDAVADAFPNLTLTLAAENFWDEVLAERLQTQTVPCYGNSSAFLIEIPPPIKPPRLGEQLFELRMRGLLPVMAHPERYVAIQKEPERAEALGRTAALVVDLGAIDGAHGRAEMKTARFLVEEGLAHAAATDIHTPNDQRAIAAGMAWIKKRLGDGALHRLLAEHPRRILHGEFPA